MGEDVMLLPDPLVNVVQSIVIVMQFLSVIICVYQHDAGELIATEALSRKQQDDIEDFAQTIRIAVILRRCILAAALTLIAARICGYI